VAERVRALQDYQRITALEPCHVDAYIPACVDALGNPVRLNPTVGRVGDVTQGVALVECLQADAVIADKGYDNNAWVSIIEESGAQGIIPQRSNRITKRDVDWHRYKARNLLERFFNRLKQFRRLATRYDQFATRLMLFCNSHVLASD
jgi:transposase